MNRVARLREIRSEIDSLRDEEKRLSRPIAVNMGMIGNLYDLFSMSLKRIRPQASPKDTESRKMFLYAILYLFSPVTLIGDVMRHKLRECVSGVIGCTPTGVSRDYKTAMFFYTTYQEFRECVDGIIADMLEILGKEDD